MIDRLMEIYLGLVAPGVLFLGSLYAVVRLALRLRELRPWSRPPWQYGAAHVFLSAATVALPVVGVLVVAIVPAVLIFELRQARTLAVRDSGGVTGSGSEAETPMRRQWGTAAFIAASGTLLPWATGLGVKLYLDAQGRPTYPIAGFLTPNAITFLLLATIATWSFPFLILASAVVVPWRIGFGGNAPGRDSMVPVWTAWALGMAAGVPVYVSIFWEWDALTLLVPLGTGFLLPMALGYGAGWGWVRRRGGVDG